MAGMEKTLPRDIGTLDDLFAFISDFVEEEGLGEAVKYSLDLVMEELFVNMVRYQAGGRDVVDLRLERENDRLKVTLVDYGVEPFDITKKEPYDTTRPIEERQPGGVGILLVHRMMDDVAYEHRDGNSIITLIKQLESTDVSGQADG